MRKIIILLACSFALAISPLIISEVFADLPPDPGADGPGSGDQPVGGGSPIFVGFIILAYLGAAYGVKRIYDFRNSENAK